MKTHLFQLCGHWWVFQICCHIEGRFEAANIHLPKVENTAFTIRAQFPGSQKNVSLNFESFVKTHLGNTVLFHDKTRQGTVFFETWLPYLLLLWLSEPELSNDFPARSVKQPVSFRKFKDLAKAAVVNKRKMNQWGFLAGLHSCFVTQSYLTLVTPWTAACQVSLSFTISWSLLKLISIQSVMPSNHLVLCHPLLLPPLIFPSIRVFSNESALHIRWPKYWSFSFSISSSNEYSGLISFRIDWFDLLAVQGTLKSLFQQHSLKASVLRCSLVLPN